MHKTWSQAIVIAHILPQIRRATNALLGIDPPLDTETAELKGQGILTGRG
jgi:hypothetical protein